MSSGRKCIAIVVIVTACCISSITCPQNPEGSPPPRRNTKRDAKVWAEAPAPRSTSPSPQREGSHGELQRNHKREGGVFVPTIHGLERATPENSTVLKKRPETFGGDPEHRSPTPEERPKTPERPLSGAGTFGRKTPEHGHRDN